jgi:dienelactone hydrolase
VLLPQSTSHGMDIAGLRADATLLRVRLVVEPSDGLMDEAPVVQVAEVGAGTEVLLELTTEDADGRRWRSSARFLADGSGVVDLSRDSPVDGTYLGPDVTGLWWSMEFASEDLAPAAFVASADMLEYRLDARAGLEHSSLTLVRRLLAPGCERESATGDGFTGPLFLPGASRRAPGVVLVPGSTGAGAMEPTAALLASRGFCALVAAYMEEKGLPRSLKEIPVEVVSRAVERLGAHPRVGGGVGVVSASVGTEGALAALALSAAHTARCAVAIAPSSVVWQALPENGQPPKTASWSHQGKPLPWLPMHGERVLPELVKHALLGKLSRHPRPKALHMRPAYEPSLGDEEAVARAAIPVEQIACPLMLVSGGDDQMYPAKEMADAILERRRRSGVGDEDRHLHFPEAGHFFRPPTTPTTVPWTESLVAGGEPEATARAQEEAWRAVVDFLRDHLA